MQQTIIHQKMSQAFRYFQSGNISEANRLASEVLNINPKLVDALHLKGVLAGLQSNHAEAEVFLRKAVDLEKKNHFIFFNLAKSLSELNKDNESLKWHRKALELEPKHDNAWLNYGKSLFKLKDHDLAILAYDRAIEINPELVQGLIGKAICLYKKKNYEDALIFFDRSIELDSNIPEIWNERGLTLYELNHFEKALSSYERSISLKPEYVDAYFNMANALIELKRLNDALTNYEKAINLNPDYADAYNNRGNVLLELDRLEDALFSYENAISLNPKNSQAYNNRGFLLQALNQLEAAIVDYDHAISLNPDYAEAYWNKSLALLLKGEYELGLKLYEWRWKTKENSNTRRNFNQPLWLGEEDIAGKTILLHAEQGLGDAIQFCRYAKLVKAKGAQVVLEVQKTLLGLFKNLSGVDVLVEQGQPLPEFDYQCPLMSLPLAFKTSLESIPSPGPYLTVSEDKREKWAKKLGKKTKPRIGIAWSSVSSFKLDKARSMELKTFIESISCDRFEYICLQKEIKKVDLELFASLNNKIRFFGSELNDFEDTAALAGQLDLVISTCTSVPHLTAALGKPTWILLTYVPDWRWLLNRVDNPWYASAKLYRQHQDRGWESVTKIVSEDLYRFQN